MNETLKNIIRLSSGQVTAQIIILVTTPIITRIYSPEEYGIFAIYFSLVMLISPIAPLKFNYALLLPEKRQDAVNLLALSFISISVVFLILIFFSIIIRHYVIMPKDWINKGFTNYILIVPFGCLFSSCYQTVIMWALRDKHYNVMLISRISSAAIERAIALSTGYYTPIGSFGLVLGRIFGHFVSLILIFHRVILPEKKYFLSCVNLKNLNYMARRYREYHLLSTLSLFFSKASREIPILLISLFFQLEIAAYYAFTMRIINLPIMFIGDAISKVFLQKSNEIKNNKIKLLTVSSRLLNYLFFIAFPIVILAYYYCHFLITKIFGHQWSEVGNYSKILIFSFFSQFLYNPISVLYDTLELQRQKIIFDNLILFARISSILIGFFIYNDIIPALWLLTILSVLIHFFSIMYIFNSIGKNYLLFISDTFKILFIIFPFIISTFYIKKNFGEIDFIGFFLILVILSLQSIAIWKSQLIK